MGTLYLIRHGAPELPPDGEKRCLGRTDVPLSREGGFQAALVGRALPVPDAVYTSRLHRAAETGRIAFGRVDGQHAELNELDLGAWDGLSFREIRERWSALYEARGKDPLHVVPPLGEPPLAALDRFRAAVEDLAREEGTVAVVAHAGVIRLLLCALTGQPEDAFLTLPQPYGCVNRLAWNGGELTVEETLLRPRPTLTEEVCAALLRGAGCGENIIAHCRRVAEVALGWADALAERGHRLDRTALRGAALLHDAARGLPGHASAAGDWLRRAGYPAEGVIVERHHDWNGGAVDEAALLFLADKHVKEDRFVTLAERFGESEKKCDSPEARAAHARRRAEAEALEGRLQALLEQ